MKKVVIYARVSTKVQEYDRQLDELRQYAAQSKNALVGEIANLVSDKVVKESVADVVASKDFVGNFLVALATKWTANEPIVIANLKAFFAAKAKDLLDKGVSINEVNGLKTLFTVKPADGSYKVDFGAEEFENYFKSFLRPQLVEMLF